MVAEESERRSREDEKKVGERVDHPEKGANHTKDQTEEDEEGVAQPTHLRLVIRPFLVITTWREICYFHKKEVPNDAIHDGKLRRSVVHWPFPWQAKVLEPCGVQPSA
jgi:hypothetical protein